MSSVDLSPEERAKIVAERADVKYGPFASLHEAYGVLAEEVFEFDEVCIANVCVNPRHWLETLRVNDSVQFCHNAMTTKQILTELLATGGVSADGVEEAIDVIAVCDRIIAQWGEPS